jgi:TolB-like protein
MTKKLCISGFLFKLVFLMTLIAGVMQVASSAGVASDMKLIAAILAQDCVFDSKSKDLKNQLLIISQFTNKSTGAEVDAVLLQDKLTATFRKAKWFKVIDRDKMNIILDDIGLTADNLNNLVNMKKAGKSLSSNYIMTGIISGIKGSITVECKIVQIDNGEVLIRSSFSCNDDTETSIIPPAAGTDDTKHIVNIPAVTDIKSDSKTEIISWTSNEIVVTNTAGQRSKAVIDSVKWLVEDKIFGNAKDVYATWKTEIYEKIYASPEKIVNDITPRNDAYYITLNFTQLTRELVGIIFGRVTPRIAVISKELINNREIADSSIQTMLSSVLNGYRFQVVDIEQAEAATLREAILQMETGDKKAENLISKTAGELQADMIASNVSNAESRTDNNGFDANIVFKIVEGTTGRLIASINQTFSLTKSEEPKLSPTGNVMALKSMQSGTDKTSIRMVSEMLKTYGIPVFRVRVWNVKSFKNSDMIQNKLKEVLPDSEISNASIDLRSTNSASFNIRTKQDARSIASAIEATTGLKVEITGIDCRSISCEVK